MKMPNRTDLESLKLVVSKALARRIAAGQRREAWPSSVKINCQRSNRNALRFGALPPEELTRVNARRHSLREITHAFEPSVALRLWLAEARSNFRIRQADFIVPNCATGVAKILAAPEFGAGIWRTLAHFGQFWPTFFRFFKIGHFTPRVPAVSPGSDEETAEVAG
jgi:hypothetical protein